ETVALDLALTDELVRAGLIREVIRLVQEARKNTGFDVTDRIALAWSATGDDPETVAAAMSEHRDALADEVLAVEIHDTLDALPNETDRSEDELGLTFRIARS